MRLPIYLICAALILVIKAEENNGEYYESFLEPLNVVAPEREAISYLLPKVIPKYRREWDRLPNPGFYMMADNNINTETERMNSSPETRIKRAEFMKSRGSLSIVNSLDALRNKLVMEMARKKTQQNAARNRQLLQSLGKRSFITHRSLARFNNNM